MSPLVEVADLTYAYPDGTPALAGVSFAVEEGDRVAILGPTGAGKSTLLLHLNGLLLPSSGSVIVAGVTVTRDTCATVRRSIGLVFQDPDDQLFLPTLLEDVAFGPLNEGRSPGDAERLALAVLADLGLAGEEHRAAHHLSGGQKRLAALATVLVSRPSVLILDEPTGNLDATGRAKVVELLRQRRETLVIATHDLEVAGALCNRCVVLDSGRLAAAGPTSKVLADRVLLARYRLVAPLEQVALGTGGLTATSPAKTES